MNYYSLIPIFTVQAKGVLMKGKSLEQDKEDLGNVNEYMFE